MHRCAVRCNVADPTKILISFTPTCTTAPSIIAAAATATIHYRGWEARPSSAHGRQPCSSRPLRCHRSHIRMRTRAKRVRHPQASCRDLAHHVARTVDSCPNRRSLAGSIRRSVGRSSGTSATQTLGKCESRAPTTAANSNSFASTNIRSDATVTDADTRCGRSIAGRATGRSMGWPEVPVCVERRGRMCVERGHTGGGHVASGRSVPLQLWVRANDRRTGAESDIGQPYVLMGSVAVHQAADLVSTRSFASGTDCHRRRSHHRRSSSPAADAVRYASSAFARMYKYVGQS